MPKHRKIPSSRKSERLEWIGGRISPPFYFPEGEESVRAEIAIWLEIPSDLIVGQEMIGAGDTDGAVGRALRTALKTPFVGHTRSPDRIRVADSALAKEVRAVVGDAIPITVAPTPELGEILKLMIETMPGPEKEASYFEGGRIPTETVAKLFRSARLLFDLAPWNVAADDLLLRLDIPALEVDGACLSIIGKLGQSLGLLIFPSLEGYFAFHQAAVKFDGGSGPVDLGSGWLALDFERGADIPDSMRREVAVHDWPLAGADAYPQVTRRESDGYPRPLTPRDVTIAAACASALSVFFAKYRNLFGAENFEPVSESYFDEDDIEVRFTLPYESSHLFGFSAPDLAEPDWICRLEETGRNDLCPCGSGRKYKKCHMPFDQDERAAWRASGEAHGLDEYLVSELCAFAEDRFGSAWLRYENDFKNASKVPTLALHWAVHHFQVDGGTVSDRFINELGRHLPADERNWLEAQRKAWLTVWEVIEVEPGESLTLQDRLSGEIRRVRDASASQSLVLRDCILARVVEHGELTLFTGMHPHLLPPQEAEWVVNRARNKLRRKRDVPVERLRDEAYGRFLIRRWEEAVEVFHAWKARPPEVHNSDGDPLLLTTDHFEIKRGAKNEVLGNIDDLPDTDLLDPDDETAGFVFLRSREDGGKLFGSTLIGCVLLSGSSLKIETNSMKRADALRERVEAVCGERIRHRVREHADPLSEAAPPRTKAGATSTIPPQEGDRLALEYKRQHYDDWVDRPLPALEGRTPREATRTKTGRAEVDLLLKDMENREQRMAGDAAYDFSILREKLGLK